MQNGANKHKLSHTPEHSSNMFKEIKPFQPSIVRQPQLVEIYNDTFGSNYWGEIKDLGKQIKQTIQQNSPQFAAPKD